MEHHLTIDVEEYFHASALERVAPYDTWESLESRVEIGLYRILQIMERRSARGTFFVLGWLAERRPDLVREISDAGHEIASHGWDHRRVSQQTPAELRSSLSRSKALLEDTSGQVVTGFRAPSFSIVPGSEWALDVLLETGYRYDSSLFPIRRPGYGYPGTNPDPHLIERPAGTLLEVPPATLRWPGVRVPAGGGAYFRFFPYHLVRSALKSCERRGVPGTFYIHPWELDPHQPRLSVGLHTRIRHYTGLSRTADRLDRLLSEFRFVPIAPEQQWASIHA